MPTDTGADTQGSRTERFAAYIRQAALAAGYDVDSPRGGGRTELARATGMSQSSVGRMLAGRTLPDPNYLEALAIAVRRPLTELLVESGVASRRALPDHVLERVLDESPLTNLSPAEAALKWGIKSPDRIAVLESLVRTLQEQERLEEERGRSGKAG